MLKHSEKPQQSYNYQRIFFLSVGSDIYECFAVYTAVAFHEFHVRFSRSVEIRRKCKLKEMGSRRV